MEDIGASDTPEERYERNVTFARPGSNSALRASSARNPRCHPCPTCKAANRLTAADVARGYQCDACADSEEGFGP